MRIRTIKPDFWTDAKVSKLTYLARLLFIGLWNVADDEGRFKSDPRIRWEYAQEKGKEYSCRIELLGG